jgi:hypothetical protein
MADKKLAFREEASEKVLRGESALNELAARSTPPAPPRLRLVATGCSMNLQNTPFDLTGDLCDPRHTTPGRASQLGTSVNAQLLMK